MTSTIDPADVGATRILEPDESSAVATRAAGLIDRGSLDADGTGEAVLLWRTDSSEACLNTWWQRRDSGYHDHDGSGGGVHVIAGEVIGEYLRIGSDRVTTHYRASDAFAFAGDSIHRVDHLQGAVTVHVHSPPLRSIGHYELVDGELRRQPFAPNEVSPPSVALTDALS